MSTEITTAFVKQYVRGITLLQQQLGSHFRDAVRHETIKGDQEFFDQVDATSMTKRTTRHADTAYTDVPHRRRSVTTSPYDTADLIDRPDLVRTLTDPQSAYVKSFAAAANRTIDDVIIAAFFADAKTGVSGGETEEFNTAAYATGGAGRKIDNAGAVMTVEKLVECREAMEALETDANDEWYIAVSAKVKGDLLDDTKVTSSDYNTVKALVHGEIDTFLGFRFVPSERLTIDGANVLCPVWTKSSMLLATGQEPRGSVDVLPTKRNSIQVFYSLDVGATRMNSKGVLQLVTAK